MKKPRVLYISQEMVPYTDANEIANITRQLPQAIQEKGKEIRIFMPRYGCINERRHQLHEVIRLSGMNLIINDNDHPLIIKVASIQAAKMQVYFIDNEDYFQRKATTKDKNGSYFDDNDERAIFFSRGVLETVKKLGWQPDIVHCHGWMTSLAPLYLKKSFNEDPNYAETKVIYTVYEEEFPKNLHKDMHKKAMFDGVDKHDVDVLKTPSCLNLNKIGIDFADAVIKGSSKINPELDKYIKKSGKPYLDYQAAEDYASAYDEFYDEVLEMESVFA